MAESTDLVAAPHSQAAGEVHRGLKTSPWVMLLLIVMTLGSE